MKSKISGEHRPKLSLTGETDLWRRDDHAALSNLSIYCIWKNLKLLYRNNKFEISGTTWDETFELIDASYSIPGIHYYFEHIVKNNETQIHKQPVHIYINKIQHRLTFKVKFEFFTIKIKKLIGSTEEKTIKNKNTDQKYCIQKYCIQSRKYWRDTSCDIVSNQYLSDSWVLPTFVHDESLH